MSLGISGRTTRSRLSLSLAQQASFFFLPVYVSTLTSLAIAVDRYFVIVHPFRSRMRLGVCILLIIVIWIVGISISLPLAIYMRFDQTKCEVRELDNEQVSHPNVRFRLSLSFFLAWHAGILAAVHISTILQLLLAHPSVSHSILRHLLQLLQGVARTGTSLSTRPNTRTRRSRNLPQETNQSHADCHGGHIRHLLAAAERCPHGGRIPSYCSDQLQGSLSHHARHCDVIDHLQSISLLVAER